LKWRAGMYVIRHPLLGLKRSQKFKEHCRIAAHKRAKRMGYYFSKLAIKNQVSGMQGKKHTLKTIRKMSECKKGSKNPFWRGGVSKERDRYYRSYKYRIWREKVFARDNWVCQKCGARNGGGIEVYLEAHHIKPFNKFKKLVYVVSNGITLCKKCHYLTDTYGGKANYHFAEEAKRVQD